MDILRWQVGAATVLRIPEIDATNALDGLIVDLDPVALSDATWLRPHFVDDAGRLKGLVQAFVVLLGGVTVIVDPGVGNGKQRPAVPGWSDLDTDFLDRMRTTGVDPDSVDYVVNTHLHFDHVGWHTRLVDGVWLPTFPRARYVMSAGEFAYWDTSPQDELADQLAGFDDSVRPVHAAGLAELVPDNHVICDGVRLIPSPGHTPHHVSVMIESDGESAVITGDVTHHPCQIAYPGWGPATETDSVRARAARVELLERFADSPTLVIGSHFADPVAGQIRREGDGFRFVTVDG
jgi:glyoxylase-like metal-dependent hydrolase (beta-lactamase superfamily II)